MLPYYLIFTILAVFSLTDNVKKIKNLKFFLFFISVTLLIFFAGLRSPEVDPDYYNYLEQFVAIPSLEQWMLGEYKYSFSETRMEPAFLAYASFIKLFTDNHTWVFVGISLLSVGIASYNYYKFSPYMFLTLLLFFVHTYLYRDMIQVRAAIAASIALFLIPQLYYHKYGKAFVTIILASFFHVAALSLFIIYLLSFVKLTRKKIIIGVILSLILGYIGISHIIIQVLPNLGYVTQKIIHYSKSQYAESLGVFNITNVKNLIILLIPLFFWKKLEKKVPYFNVFIIFIFTATTWRILFSDFGIVAGRVATFFSIVEVLLVPSFILIFKQKIIPHIIIILYALITLYLNTELKINPYSSIISFI